MKKFLVLSFLMVVFASAVSFAQTTTTGQWTTNGYHRVQPSFSSYHNSAGDLVVDMGASVDTFTNPLPPGVTITRIAVNILNDSNNELPTGGYTYDFYNEGTGGTVWLNGVFTESLFYRTQYDFLVDYSDNTYESYSIFVQR